MSIPPTEPDPAALERLRSRHPGPGTAWLSVGRLAPNKAHHQTIAALFVARASSDPDARLTLVGAPSEPAYAAALRRLRGVARVWPTRSTSSRASADAELAAYYRFADVLVMLSDHEGFGVPLVEAMGQGLPIVAYDAGAVGEVLGGAGVLLAEKHPRQVAEAVSRADGRPGRAAIVWWTRARSRFAAMGLEDAGRRAGRSGPGGVGDRLAAPAGEPRRPAGLRPSETRATRLCAHGRHPSLPLHAPTTGSDAVHGDMKSGTEVGPGSDIFQRLLKERIVFIGSAIDQNTANLVCSQLILLEAENQERDISVYINSPGGSVTDGLAIYDTMQYVRCDVRTICVGLAASMGQFLLCAGTPGKRFALPHSRILMHQPSGQMQGQASDIAIQAEQIIYLKRMMAERIAFHTGQPVERIEADSDRDRWFTAEEAREYGFIDEVIQKDAMDVPTAGAGAASK